MHFIKDTKTRTEKKFLMAKTRARAETIENENSSWCSCVGGSRMAR